MNFIIDTQYHMWATLALTLLAVLAFAREKIPLEMTSIFILSVLLLMGQFFPIFDPLGRNLLDAGTILSGLANPSLIAVMALLIMGQGIMHTDVLRPLSNRLVTKKRSLALVSVAAILIFVGTTSAFMNNTPLVVIAIPLLQIMAKNMGLSESRMMMPLSFVAILGGMTTLIGSSTNLLVSSAMDELGFGALSFFSFVEPGLMLAGIGLVYIFLVLPRLLPDRTSMSRALIEDEKEFVAELDIHEGSNLIGMVAENGVFPELKELKVRLIQRSGQLILPPFDHYQVTAGDIMIVAATRSNLTSVLGKFPGFLLSASDEEKETPASTSTGSEIEDQSDEGEEQPIGNRMLAEIMITPASRYIDMTLEQMGLPYQYAGTIILGIQRRARVVRRRLGRIRLEPGDVLLIATGQSAIKDMQASADLIVLAGSVRDIPLPKKAPIAGLIFLGAVGSAASGLVTIPVAAFVGAVLMLATGCLNMRQALRAMDRKIYLLVAAALALGSVLQITQGAEFIANAVQTLPYTDSPLVLASLLFLMVAICTNLLTNNACAILFTPIALNMAQTVGVDPIIFGITVVLAANCSFASPIGYQTNLLVMGPGHYRFGDFLLAGIPLMILLWLGYIGIAYYYYELPIMPVEITAPGG